MKKKIGIALVGCVLVLGVLGGIKTMQIRTLMAQSRHQPVETVTAVAVVRQEWETTVSAVGSLAAVQGTMIAAEQPGRVERVGFVPGTIVQAGDLLVQQDVAAETAQLRAAEAAADLARISLQRSRSLLAEGAVAKSDFDSVEAQYKQTAAQADNLRALIAKKTICAPFSGLAGIRLVNAGQMLSAGEAVVSLYALDPLYVNFSLPQQQLLHLRPGLVVRVQTDALPGRTIDGTITAINPQVEQETRTVTVQATVRNEEMLFRPGMFVSVTVVLSGRETVLAVPATAVLNAPYSDSVFIVEDAQVEAGGTPAKVVRQQFVRLGSRRGDFVAVAAGLAEGQTVVSTGVFKLRNGQTVAIDNSLAPVFNLSPVPENR